MLELLGYARVSTVEQNVDLERDALRAAGCWKVFTDHVTGIRERRPELDRLLEQLRPGDTGGGVAARPAGSFICGI